MISYNELSIILSSIHSTVRELNVSFDMGVIDMVDQQSMGSGRVICVGRLGSLGNSSTGWGSSDHS